jgi:hypothetical protein
MRPVDVLVASPHVGLAWVLASWHGWKARHAEQPDAAIFVVSELPLVKRSGLRKEVALVKRVFPGAEVREVRSLRRKRRRFVGGDADED